MEPGAKEVKGLNGLGRVCVGLLLDDVPAVADPERRRSHSQPPRQMEPAAYLANGGVDKFEALCVTEP